MPCSRSVAATMDSTDRVLPAVGGRAEPLLQRCILRLCRFQLLLFGPDAVLQLWADEHCTQSGVISRRLLRCISQCHTAVALEQNRRQGDEATRHRQHEARVLLSENMCNM